MSNALSLGQQENETSQSLRKSTLNINGMTHAEAEAPEWTHWKRS